MKKLVVELGERSYPIYIRSGGLQHISDYLRQHRLEDDLYIITDSTVHQLYADAIARALEKGGHRFYFISVKPGELSKSLATAGQIYTRLIESGATRKSIIVALGGGVVGDLAGFIAATFLRGIRFVQIPTTVLAQVDSSVGGKVGINHPLGKNLIGAFYQPEFVLIDPYVLKTLPLREIKAGFAEIIKYGFIRDESLFSLLQEKHQSFLSLHDYDLIEKVIHTCCHIKAAVVSQDEKESGLRAILNFGHTAGHALESVTHYKVFLHGEAVLHGIRAALYLSRVLAYLSPDEEARGQQFITALAPPAIPRTVTTTALLSAMQHDKKRTREGQLWVLLKRIGQSFLSRDVDEEAVEQALDYMLKAGQ